MRRAGIAALAMLLALGCDAAETRPAWEDPPPPPREGPVVPAGALHRSVLESGLQVLVLEDRSLPRVAMGLLIPRGAASLPPEQAGLTSYTTELMNRGAGERDALRFDVAAHQLDRVLVRQLDERAGRRTGPADRDLEPERAIRR